jgi:hypothetical protein
MRHCIKAKYLPVEKAVREGAVDDSKERNPEPSKGGACRKMQCAIPPFRRLRA